MFENLTEYVGEHSPVSFLFQASTGQWVKRLNQQFINKTSTMSGAPYDSHAGASEGENSEALDSFLVFAPLAYNHGGEHVAVAGVP